MDSGYTNRLNELKNRASKYITIPNTNNTNSKYNLVYNKHDLIELFTRRHYIDKLFVQNLQNIEAGIY